MTTTERRFEEIKLLWEGANEEKKLDYLFEAVGSVFKKIDVFHDQMVEGKKEIDLRCTQQKENCDRAVADRGKIYITHGQAKWFAVVMILVCLSFLLGLGIITYQEFFGIAKRFSPV